MEPKKLVFIVLAALVATYLFDKMVCSESNTVRTYTGSTASIDAGSSSIVLVAVNETSCRELEQAYSDLDQVKMTNMALQGRLFAVENGASVVILENGINRVKIRITSGSQNGLIAWVPRGFVK